MSCNMHKTLLCMVLAAAYGAIANWYEEEDMEIKKLTKEQCVKK